MPLQNLRTVILLFAFTVASAATGFTQLPASTRVVTIPAGNDANYTWEFAQSFDPSKHKLYVVTLDQPTRRHTCHIQSFTNDKLVCSRAIGGFSRTYLPQQIVAILLPGDDELRRWVLLGINGGLGASIWGTVVIAAACPACAVGTGIMALWFLGAAGTTLVCGDVPDRLLYLAPGHELSSKLGYVQRVTS